MLIYCPTVFRLFYGENMTYNELMGHIKQYLHYQRAPRGSLEIVTGKETWVYKGQTKHVPRNKIEHAVELPWDRVVDATPFLKTDEAPATVADDDGPIKVGDRVSFPPGVTGTVVSLNDDAPFAAVARDDGVEGAGPKGSWLVDKNALTKIGPSTMSDTELAKLKADMEALKGQIPTLEQLKEIIAEQVEKAKIPKEVKVTVCKPDLPDVKIDSPHHKLPEVLEVASLLKGYSGIILVGPAGTGKSTLCEQVADALEAPYYYTPQAMFKTDIVGCHTPYGYVSTPFREAYTLPRAVHTFEEFDSYSPAAGVAANVGLANGHMTFPDSPLPVKRGEDVILFANMNTWATGADRVYVGRNQLDAATLDRFVFIEVDYDEALEGKLCASQVDWLKLCWKIRARAAELKIRKVVSTRRIVIGQKLLDGGMEWDRVERIVLREGLSDFDWERLAK